MSTTPEPVQLTPYTHSSKEDTRHRLEAFRNSPPPQEGGTLTTQIECGNAVLRVYRHEGDPNYAFTVSLARKAGDGITEETARFCAADLADLRRATREAQEAMDRGIRDGIRHQVDEARWARREAAKPAHRSR